MEHQMKAASSDPGGALVTLETASGDYPFALHMLSADSASGRLPADAVPGDAVVLVFGAERRVPAQVRWVRSPMLGLGFEDLLPATLVAAYDRPSVARPARHRVARAAAIRRGAEVARAIVRNVSRNGMMIETGLALCAGQLVQVMIGDDAAIDGQVRWARGGRAGLAIA